MSVDINRELAYKILLDMEREDSFSNLAVKKYLDKANRDDGISPDLIRRLVYGVMENRIYIDYYLDRIISKGLSGTKDKALTILRLGAYQLEEMNSVPDYAAINTSVELAKKHCKGLDSFVNGVLRNWQRKKKDIPLPDPNKDLVDYLQVKYSCHPSIVNLLLKQRGQDECQSILKAFKTRKNPTVRVNTSKADANEISGSLKDYGIEVQEGTLSSRILKVKGKELNLVDTEEFKSGKISIQSEESCWIADMCEAKPGMRVLDVCAAPGGKTTALGETMGNQGEIIACDLYPHRLNLIKENANRLGLTIIQTKALDATKEFLLKDEGFHLVLVDAPCSGLGVIRNKPEIKLSAPDMDAIEKIQKAIIRNASNNVARDGKLVYSTCTINKDENQEMVKGFLQEHPDFKLEYEKELLPHENGRDGFYIAILRRTN
ncbi:MAG: 16S rRNA (cytosine(967)-C(5))-methyltransferase RsmB [Firmicutes bacterium]|nr:16S rRNA (cytosine(967)-C(5))-methyltransferase RsmB [Bacillota bacterium]